MKKRVFEYIYNTNKGNYTSFSISDLKRQIVKDPSVSVLVYPTTDKYKTKRNSEQRSVYVITSNSIIDDDSYMLSYKNHIEEPKEFSMLKNVFLYLNNIGITNENINIFGFGSGEIYFENR